MVVFAEVNDVSRSFSILAGQVSEKPAHARNGSVKYSIGACTEVYEKGRLTMASTGRARPVSRDQLRQQTEQLGARILDVATDLFSRKGFLGTTTQEIADASGLIKGTLYYHIDSKEELLFQIHERVLSEGIRRWSPLVEQLESDSRDVLRAMILEHCRIIDKYRDSVAVFVEELKFLSPELTAAIVEKRDRYQAMLDAVIKHGVDRGELVTDDLRLAGLTTMSMMNSTYRWYRPGGRWGPERLGQFISDLVLEGLQARQPA
jgi:AcrR family transcriptional regulator